MGCRVCILTDEPDRPAAFIEGHIIQILNTTKQYAVQCGLQTQTVRRGQIRLLRPPWWDELSDLTAASSSGGPQALPNPTPVMYEVAAADADTIRSIVNNSASSIKSISHQLPANHHLPISNDPTSTSTVGGPMLDNMQTNILGVSCNNTSLPQKSSRMSFSGSKFEPISMAHTSISSVRTIHYAYRENYINELYIFSNLI